MAEENRTEKAYAEDELLKKVGEILTKKMMRVFLRKSFQKSRTKSTN